MNRAFPRDRSVGPLRERSGGRALSAWWGLLGSAAVSVLAGCATSQETIVTGGVSEPCGAGCANWSTTLADKVTEAATSAKPRDLIPASAWAPVVTGSVADEGKGKAPLETGTVAGKERRGANRDSGQSGLGVGEVVRRAISDNPLIALQQARAMEAEAGNKTALAALFPQVEVKTGAGGTMLGTFQAADTSYWSNKNRYFAGREDLSLTGRQLIYDFGASEAAIARAKAAHNSELLKVLDQSEDITQKVAQAYLKILEQRALLKEAEDNVTSLQRIFKHVEDSEKNGHGTAADVKRVRARVLDAQALKSDTEAEMRNASDRFERLAKIEPVGLAAFPALARALPKSVGDALELIPRSNPRIAALEAGIEAVRHELSSKEASTRPQVQLEMDVSNKDYRYYDPRTEVDARAMVSLRYKLYDGGLQAGEVEQVAARVMQAETRYRADREDVEADARQFFQSLQAARTKTDKLKEAAADAGKARQLYDEQFKGGKRTLLELLEVQSAFFNARRAEISNTHDELRASIGILRAVGRLTQVLAGAP